MLTVDKKREAFEKMHQSRDLTRHHLRGTYSKPQIAALWNQHVKTWQLVESYHALESGKTTIELVGALDLALLTLANYFEATRHLDLNHLDDNASRIKETADRYRGPSQQPGLLPPCAQPQTFDIPYFLRKSGNAGNSND